MIMESIFWGPKVVCMGECTGCVSVGATFLMLVDKCKLHSWGRYTMAPYALRLDFYRIVGNFQWCKISQK